MSLKLIRFVDAHGVESWEELERLPPTWRRREGGRVVVYTLKEFGERDPERWSERRWWEYHQQGAELDGRPVLVGRPGPRGGPGLSWPWAEPASVYDADGPDCDVANFDIHGVRLQVIRQVETAINSGRPRYLAKCVDCDHVVHEATTSPANVLGGHLRHAHGIERYVERCSRGDCSTCRSGVPCH